MWFFFRKMRTEGPPVSSELQLGYEDDHQNCSFDISVCGNLTEDYQAVSQKVFEGFIFNMQYFMVYNEPNWVSTFRRGLNFQIKNLSIWPG